MTLFKCNNFEHFAWFYNFQLCYCKIYGKNLHPKSGLTVLDFLIMSALAFHYPLLSPCIKRVYSS